MSFSDFPTHQQANASSAPHTAAVPVDFAFMRRHAAHWIALGFGSGLSKFAPGTMGTLWAWLSFVLLNPWLNPSIWAGILVVALFLGWWACTVTAEHLQIADPGCIVWDEILAFWLILLLITPAGFWAQLAAFGLFRLFDAAKPGARQNAPRGRSGQRPSVRLPAPGLTQ